MSSKIAKLIICPEILVEALRLPEGTKLLDVQRDDFNHYYFTIESDGLDELQPGAEIPHVLAIFETRVVYETQFREWKK